MRVIETRELTYHNKQVSGFSFFLAAFTMTYVMMNMITMLT